MEKLYGIKKVAELTGLPQSWIYHATKAGRIPHLKLGKSLRFRLSEIETWLEENRRGPAVTMKIGRPFMGFPTPSSALESAMEKGLWLDNSSPEREACVILLEDASWGWWCDHSRANPLPHGEEPKIMLKDGTFMKPWEATAIIQHWKADNERAAEQCQGRRQPRE